MNREGSIVPGGVTERVLDWLECNGPAIGSIEVAKAVGAKRSTVKHVLNYLVGCGYASARRGPRRPGVPGPAPFVYSFETRAEPGRRNRWARSAGAELAAVWR